MVTLLNATSPFLVNSLTPPKPSEPPFKRPVFISDLVVGLITRVLSLKYPSPHFVIFVHLVSFPVVNRFKIIYLEMYLQDTCM